MSPGQSAPSQDERNHLRLPGDLAEFARALALDLAVVLSARYADAKPPGQAHALRLYLVHHGALAPAGDEREARHLRALADVLQLRALGRPPSRLLDQEARA